MANIATGKGGKSFQDRELSARVRRLGLLEIEGALTGKDEEFKRAVLLKIAPTLLPRINEHGGLDGKDLPVPIFNVQSHDSNAKD